MLKKTRLMNITQQAILRCSLVVLAVTISIVPARGFSIGWFQAERTNLSKETVPKSIQSFRVIHDDHRINSKFCLSAEPGTGGGSDEATDDDSAWLSTGLLLSSFSDGLKPNPEAQDFLMRGLVEALWKEKQVDAEIQVETSVLQSPCCGPDLTALGAMETADAALASLQTQEQQREQKQQPTSWKEALHALLRTHRKEEGNDEQSLELRFLYIPTAMYALRSDSKNTPGKQRQRARADGKKRRNEIVNLLQELFNSGTNSSNDGNDNEPNVSILSVTLDLDDGSVKQPEGSDNKSRFPSNGKDAINSWNPHLIYVQGGNTFWLYHCMEKGEWTNDIVNACTGQNAAVYIGTSAGAILMGSSMETACWKGWDDPSVVPQRSTYEDWNGIKGLGLVGDASFFPHMEDHWQPLVTEKVKIAEGTSSSSPTSSYYCLRDEDACCIDGSQKSRTVLSTTNPLETVKL